LRDPNNEDDEMLKYMVITMRWGFKNEQIFDALAEAEAFYADECENIGHQVTICSFDPDDDTGRLNYIEAVRP
jgi:hypothetical protein